jgi:hypothetical protein
MDLLAPFRFPRSSDRQQPEAGQHSEEYAEGRERPRFVGWIPLLVPLAAFVLATLVYFIFWASWPY